MLLLPSQLSTASRQDWHEGHQEPHGFIHAEPLWDSTPHYLWGSLSFALLDLLIGCEQGSLPYMQLQYHNYTYLQFNDTKIAYISSLIIREGTIWNMGVMTQGVSSMVKSWVSECIYCNHIAIFVHRFTGVKL